MEIAGEEIFTLLLSGGRSSQRESTKCVGHRALVDRERTLLPRGLAAERNTIKMRVDLRQIKWPM